MAIKSGVARKVIDMDEYRKQLSYRQGLGAQVRYFIMNKARADGGKKRIAFAEGEEQKVIRARTDHGGRSVFRCSSAEEVIGPAQVWGWNSTSSRGSNDFRTSTVRREFSSLRNRKATHTVHRKVRDERLWTADGEAEGADAFVSGLTSTIR
jgi:phosphotransacetylase